MNKNELIEKLAARTSFRKSHLKSLVNAVFDEIEASVASGEVVRISGFGTFEPRQRNERKAVNLKTGEKITVPARKVPYFRAGKTFREKVKETASA